MSTSWIYLCHLDVYVLTLHNALHHEQHCMDINCPLFIQWLQQLYHTKGNVLAIHWCFDNLWPFDFKVIQHLLNLHCLPIPILWLNVLFAGNWEWIHWEPFYLPYHEPTLVIEWQGHTCSFPLGTKPLWHWRKWKSGPASKRDPRLRYRPTGKCSLYKYETTGQVLHSEVGSNQVGCSCTWPRSLSCETNTGATEEVPAPNQSWRGCNHPTSNWPYQGHQIPYLVPRTANWFSLLWSNTDHWPYAAGVCIVTGMSWWILYSQLVECSLRDNSWDLHSGVPARSGILLSDMM